MGGDIGRGDDTESGRVHNRGEIILREKDMILVKEIIMGENK